MSHPGGDGDRRTNLYYLKAPDAGETWTAADGRPSSLPLDPIKNDALVIDYETQGLDVYINDLGFDEQGRPAIVYVTSKGAAPGPGQRAVHRHSARVSRRRVGSFPTRRHRPP